MKKQTKIISILVVIAIVIALGFILNNQFGSDWSYYPGPDTSVGADKSGKDSGSTANKVELMDNQEKVELGISEQQQVQVLERDENGMVTAYKPLRSEADIITDDSWKDYASSTPAVEASTTEDIAQ